MIFINLFAVLTYQVVAQLVSISRIPSTGLPPSPRMDHSSVFSTENNIIYIFGGQNSDSLDFFNDIWAFSIASSTWDSIDALTDTKPCKQ